MCGSACDEAARAHQVGDETPAQIVGSQLRALVMKPRGPRAAAAHVTACLGEELGSDRAHRCQRARLGRAACRPAPGRRPGRARHAGHRLAAVPPRPVRGPDPRRAPVRRTRRGTCRRPGLRAAAARRGSTSPGVQPVHRRDVPVSRVHPCRVCRDVESIWAAALVTEPLGSLSARTARLRSTGAAATGCARAAGMQPQGRAPAQCPMREMKRPVA
jgi:hypothetical protein